MTALKDSPLVKRMSMVMMLTAVTFILTMGVVGAKDEVSEEILPGTGTGVPSVTVLIVLAAGFLIRPATAFLFKESVDKGFLGGIAGIALAALTAGGAALADVDNIGDDWKSVVAVTLTTAITAALAAWQLWQGEAIEWIHEKTDNLFGGGDAK